MGFLRFSPDDSLYLMAIQFLIGDSMMQLANRQQGYGNLAVRKAKL
jgi:hypothetical protein